MERHIARDETRERVAMETRQGGVEIVTGRRKPDGSLHLSVFAEDLLALAVESNGGRALTLLLTRAQAVELQQALAGMIGQLLDVPEDEAVARVEPSESKRRQAEKEA